MKRLWLVLSLIFCSSVWAQVPISALPAATTSSTGIELFPVVQSATTKKMTLAQVQAFLEGSINVWAATNFFQAINALTGTFNGIVLSTDLIISSGGTTFPGVSTTETILSSAGTAFINSTAPTDQKVWELSNIAGSTLCLYAVNDANTFSDPAVCFPRSGAIPQGMQIGSATGGPTPVGSVNSTGYYINGSPLATAPFSSGTGTVTTFIGFSTNFNIPISWYKIGNLVGLVIGDGTTNTQTSSGTGFAFGSLPAAIRPTSGELFVAGASGCFEDNGAAVTGHISFIIDSSGEVFTLLNGGATWTSTGQKGLATSCKMSISYMVP